MKSNPKPKPFTDKPPTAVDHKKTYVTYYAGLPVWERGVLVNYSLGRPFDSYPEAVRYVKKMDPALGLVVVRVAKDFFRV
jgi:hypothetical protein